ncbi:transcription antitermination factor NusB [Salinicoccus cyprini]|uniref:Transcription antitermination protein NusB n=1 Tax=Salinicoccus cyprini TaxID=2493691 RepID=A0A558AZ05_9STAP|nr:transcription antitermination factor NusB [Salinicoccus cyprini]TVT29487.1 transcription antitermination factor NusB [Salinicoccus cyprini]
MNRHEQRKKIFQIIFQQDHGLVALEETAFYDLYREYDYISRIVDYYGGNSESVDGDIRNHLTNYTLERIPKVERNILRTAISELLHGDSPQRVVINEAILLAKLYGEKDSFRFVNGVLKNFITETDKQQDGEQ